jgi:hypothetical protein
MKVASLSPVLRTTLLRSVLATTLGAGLLVGVAGCGSSGDSAATARGNVEAVVRQALTSGDPAVCRRTMTARYLDQNYRQGDTPPLEDCQFESELPGEPFAREVDFKSTRVQGNRGVVTVSVRGGQADGSVVRIELARDGKDWKLDHLAAVQIDQSRFDAASRRNAIAQGVTAGEANCAVKRLHRFYDTDELEHAIVAGKTGDFSASEVVCLGRRTLVKEFRLVLRTAAPKDAPDQIIDCVGRRLTKDASTGLLRALFAAGNKLGGYLGKATTAAAKACGKDAEAGLLPSPAAS